MSRRFRSSIPVLAIGYGISAVVNFVVNVAVGRRLGAAALGSFALAVSISRVFCAATDLGLTTHLTRSVARDPASTQRLFPRLLGFRLALIPVAGVVTVIAGFCYGEREPVLFAFVAAGQALVMAQLLYEALFLANERQQTSALLTIVMASSLAVGAGSWFIAHASLVAFGVVYAAMIAVGFSAWPIASRRTLGIGLAARLDPPALAGDLAQCWPIGISVLLGIAALKAPVLALGAFASDQDVGAFSAVDMFVTATAILQSAVTSATFPRLASTFRRDPKRYRQVFWLSNLVLAVFGLAIGMFLVFAGAPVISLVFPGRDFSAIRQLMPIVGWSTPALLLVHHNIFIFASADRERTSLWLMATWFCVLAGFQVALVPTFGLVGAAWGQLLGRIVGIALLGILIGVTRIHRGGE